MSTGLTARPVAPSSGALGPLSLAEVEITGGFWGRRQQVNSEATLAHCHEWMERLGWVGNFTAAIEGRPDDRRGVVFTDSDVYKLMEAAAWEHGRSGSTQANDLFTSLTAQIVPVQEEDGYLNTVFGRPGQPSRYSDLEWGHELYCFGHMLQAAVARARTTDGDDPFVQAARRAADHVCNVFGPNGIDRVGGHPEIELGLVELARLTGEERYLDQASWFLERRGRGTLANIHWGQAYFQDDVPIRERGAFAGHAVRALYLAASAVDIAVETGDDGLLEAMISQWERTIARRTYLTGGMGSHHDGEMFGEDFALPPDRAYSETCAGIASVMLSWRLLLATGESRFADLAERTLLNVVATSPAPDGRAFFYANPLHQRVPGVIPDPNEVSNRASSSLREPWFRVSCCPTNVARTFASLATYTATTDGDGLQVHQYADSRISTTLAGGRRVGVEIATNYPEDGTVRVTVTETDDQEWALSLRVPEWAGDAAIVDRGQRRSVGAGTVTVKRRFSPGDEIELDLDVSPRWTFPDPRIDSVRGCVAVEKGPLVLCVESVDLPPDTTADSVRVRLGDLELDDGRVVADGIRLESTDRQWPYAPSTGSHGDGGELPLHLTPYHDWANRGPSTMRVWLPTV